MSNRRRTPCLAFVLALASANGCVGRIGDPGTSPASTPTPVAPTPRVFSPAPSGLRRLTVTQYQNSLRDLFGDSVTVPTDLEPDRAEEGFASVVAATAPMPSRAVEQFDTGAFGVAHSVFADTTRRRSLVGCEPSSATDSCIHVFLRAFGRRAWRRTLTDTEITRYASIVMSVSASLGSTWSGIEYAVAGMLTSPNFLYRVELGETDPAHSGRRRYTAFEMASRISFLLWDSTPDASLLDAAEHDELLDAEHVRSQAGRLLADPRARTGLRRFVSDLYGLAPLDALVKDPTMFPQVTNTLGPAMRTEIEMTVEDLVFDRNGDFRDILDTRTTFVDAELARLYGMTPPSSSSAFVRTTRPSDGPRAGILGFAGIAARYARATATSPTLRGKFVRERLLCQDIGQPPPNVAPLPDPMAVGSGSRTVRERLEQHRRDPMCSGCHTLMDPPGLALEHFDPIGAYRTMDFGEPVDSSTEIDGTPVNDAIELSAWLRDNSNVDACTVRQVYRNATGHRETAGEEVVIERATHEYESAGYRLRELLVAVVTSDGFRFASEPQ